MKDVSEQKKKSAPEAKGATAVRKFHTHSIPLDMEDIARDWEKPVVDAGIAAKASVIVRVGMLDLGAGTGSFRVREMMHRIAGRARTRRREPDGYRGHLHGWS